METTRSLTKSLPRFASIVLLANISCTNDTPFGTSNNKMENLLTLISFKSGWSLKCVILCQDLSRDKFVFGLNDDHTKERLLREEKLDLSTTVAIAQWAESSSGKQMRDTHTEINVMQRSESECLLWQLWVPSQAQTVSSIWTRVQLLPQRQSFLKGMLQQID